MSLDRRAFLAALGAATLAGCTSDSDSLSEYRAPETTPGSTADPGDDGTAGGAGNANDAGARNGTADTDASTDDETPTGRTTPPPTAGDLYDTPPATRPRLPLPMGRGDLRGKARSGGPPKDGIPSIDEPRFVGAFDADSLADGDVVFGLARDGVAKAYPQRILVHHEICNDVVDDDPVAVTYCPLTGTAMGFERGDTTFGVSGRLLNNNLIMYDREHEAWWPQVLASSIPGPWNESPPAASLREFRLIWTTWNRWREQHPDTLVLSEDTGYIRDYGRDPYGTYNPKGGYYADGATLFPRLNDDDQYHLKRMVLGARTPEGAVAFPRNALRERGTIAGELGGDPVVGVHDPRFGTGYVYRNPEGQSVTLRDGSVDVDGTGYDPDSLPLERVYAFDAMWFAWYGFYPDTSTHE